MTGRAALHIRLQNCTEMLRDLRVAAVRQMIGVNVIGAVEPACCVNIVNLLVANCLHRLNCGLRLRHFQPVEGAHGEYIRSRIPGADILKKRDIAVLERIVADAIGIVVGTQVNHDHARLVAAEIPIRRARAVIHGLKFEKRDAHTLGPATGNAINQADADIGDVGVFSTQ